MTTDLLREAGEFLHGSRWQVPLARQTGTSERMMRYYASGQAVPEEKAEKIRELVEAKGRVGAALLKKLR